MLKGATNRQTPICFSIYVVVVSTPSQITGDYYSKISECASEGVVGHLGDSLDGLMETWSGNILVQTCLD